MVFPIPKPHEWKCQLKNTRPITLLEVIRKSLVNMMKGIKTTYVHEQQNRSKDICAGDVLNASGDLRTDNAELKFSVP
ncbi:hypothetical protein RirG_012730 [Rhizophagus irregularis DAOM 197198w]|uniref:Uncharacterized protein n=1 Tax=Rhizophagus irregularis (strain DAOM 197198w) TaxID=1432141 RepID=A0A015KGF2_RHIIW|nr:hypothetical protein RirG_012730 [Rhizophagus irregularis DAOM 197198w]